MEKSTDKKPFLAFVKNAKIPTAVSVILIALTTGFSGFHSARGMLAVLALSGMSGLNDVIAFLAAAVSGALGYELITLILSRTSIRALGASAIPLRRDMRPFFACAYFCSGLTKLLYFAFPFIAAYGEIFVDFIWCAAFFALFIAYACANYYHPSQRARVIVYLGSCFLILYGLIAAVTLLSEVLA